MTPFLVRSGRMCPDTAHAAGPVVDLRAVSVHHDGVPVLDGITFALDPGDLLAVVGPNGAGKTTLLKVLAGTLPPTSGDVRVFGHRPSGHICIAYLPQRSQVDSRFPVSVADVVMMGRVGRLGPLRRPRAADRSRVGDALSLVGISHLSRRQIGELSGGEQQRMFIARALAQEASLLLLDEPLAGLDVPTQQEILTLLGELHSHGIASIVTLHELDLVESHFPRVLLLNRKASGFGAPRDVFTPDRLRDAYGSGIRIVETLSGPVAVGGTCCEGDGDGRD